MSAMNRIDAAASDLLSIPVRRPGVPSPTAATPSASFGETLGRALGEVEKLQQSADRESARVAEGGGNLHETALALEKADVAMRLAVKVRNRVVEAYQEVMRMSV